MRIRRLRRPSIDRATLRDPRIALLAVPVSAVLLLMTSNRGASPVPIAASSTTTTTTSTSIPTEVEGTSVEAADRVQIPDGNMIGDDGSDGSSFDGTSGGSSSGGSGSRRSSGGSSGGSVVSVPAAVQSATTVPGATTVPPATNVPATTTTIPELPPAVVSEAANPAVMGLVGVGVAALVVNGAVLMRRRRAREEER